MKRLFIRTILVVVCGAYAHAQDTSSDSSSREEYKTVIYAYIDPDMPGEFKKYSEYFTSAQLREIPNMEYVRTVRIGTIPKNNTDITDFADPDFPKTGRVILIRVKYREFITRRIAKEADIGGDYLIKKDYVRKIRIDAMLLRAADKSVLLKDGMEIPLSEEGYHRVRNDIQSRIAALYPYIPEPAHPAPPRKPVLFCCSASVVYEKPYGKFSDMVRAIIGVDIRCAVKGLWDYPFNPLIATGLTYGFSNNSRIHYYSGLPLTLGFSYDIASFRTIDLSAQASAGYILHYVSSHTSSFYRDPVISAHAAMNVRLNELYAIRGAVGYTMFFEKRSRRGTAISASIGAERKFVR